jgi:hypothetical protein
MKRLTNDQVHEAIKELLDRGEIVIGKIRVNDGENIFHYTALSACPAEHQEGYRRAFEICKGVNIRDVMYDPVFMATEHAQSIATLE